MSNNSLLIKNANIVDGTGTDAFVGDVLVEDGVIKNVGNIDGEFETVIERYGLILTPGFIDIHTHFDPQLLLGWLCNSFN
jgi:N-acyl-D-aspartate/D-glutamate deacylase